MHGYGGTMLRVDLGTGSLRFEPIDEAFARTWLGGNGFAARVILDGDGPLAAPLAPENTLVFAVGPFAGTPVWGSSRGTVAGISPQTGYFADSSFGGDFPHAQKLTGCDAIVVTGASPEPVYLVVGDDGAAIRSAADLWGTTTFAAVERLVAREGSGAVPAVIGPAGERGVAFASILFAGRRHGTAGRCGMGAVMGAKRLKAIVVRGSRAVTLHDPDGLRRFLNERLASVRKNTAWLTTEGTSHLVDVVNSAGLLGTRNDTREVFEDAASINADAFRDAYAPKNVACRGCPVACGKVGGAGGPGAVVKLPEYETLYALGSMLDNPDLASIVEMNLLCDRYGLDTVSTGATIAFAAECLEKGAVDAADLGGDVRFGDGAGAIDLVRATAFGEGPGTLLALGSAGLARRLGHGTERFLYTAKGLEIPGHSARGVQSMALGYATSTRGGSHHDTRPNYAAPYDGTIAENHAAFSIASQDWSAVGDSLAICRYIGERGFGADYHAAMAELLRLVTGWDVDSGELGTIGARIWNAERAVNARRGMRRADDALPWRATHEPIPAGPAAGRFCPQETLEALLDCYYGKRGWDRDGVPTRRLLEELGIPAIP
jgi:aldehyde:ferredoxin oxidoreductase